METMTLASTTDLQRFLQANEGAVVYFAGEQCAVCEVLQPKVQTLLREEFPRMALAAVNCSTARELAAQEGVFSVPTVAIYFGGREVHRLTRNFSIGELRSSLHRPYELFFDND